MRMIQGEKLVLYQEFSNYLQSQPVIYQGYLIKATVNSDFVTNRYGESCDSISCEKSIVPVQNQ